MARGPFGADDHSNRHAASLEARNESYLHLGIIAGCFVVVLIVIDVASSSKQVTRIPSTISPIIAHPARELLPKKS